MNINDILERIIKIYGKNSYPKFYDGLITTIYPDKNIIITINNKECIIKNNTKCYINGEHYLNNKEEDYIDIIIELNGKKEITRVKKKYLKLKYFKLSKL